MATINEAASEFLAHRRPTSDFGHRAMRRVLTIVGNVPKEV
jgi:hypothetical protein